MINLAEREVGSVPVSMGTALAIEGLLGVYPDRPEKPAPIERYKQVWVNVRTLYRNLITLFRAEQQRAFLPQELVPGLWEDMLGIEAYLKDKVEVVFYLSDYNRLDRTFPDARLKLPRTEVQTAAHELEMMTMRQLLASRPPVQIHRYDCFIQGAHPESVMLTHITLDLLARYHFKSLELIESNTGVIKKSSQWNTKLGVKEGADLLPFNTFTLQVFGDRGALFDPQPLSLRNAVMELAKAKQWNAVTTISRIRSNLDDLPPDQAEALMKLTQTVSV